VLATQQVFAGYFAKHWLKNASAAFEFFFEGLLWT
jgi:hypothetical protein